MAHENRLIFCGDNSESMDDTMPLGALYAIKDQVFIPDDQNVLMRMKMINVDNNEFAINKRDTAHLDWDVTWQTEEGRADWQEPELFVVNNIDLLRSRDINSVVDLGCGIGRHSLLLAKESFQVHAVDASPTAIKYIEEKITGTDLDITLHESEMIALPFASDSIDYVLAWNVIYHGDISVASKVIGEVLRVIKPGGLFQGTMLSKRNTEIAKGIKVSQDTYINKDTPEKSHPHYYCNGAEMLALFHGFEPLQLMDKEHSRPGSYHWHFLMEKK